MQPQKLTFVRGCVLCLCVCDLSMTTKCHYWLSERSLRAWKNPSELLGEIIKRHQEVSQCHRRMKTSIAHLKNWTLWASSITGIHIDIWRALGFFPHCLDFVVLSSCQCPVSNLLGLETKGFCLNLKIFKIQKWQLQVMTRYTISVESQQETLRAYTRVFAFLFLSLRILSMSG
uniref:Uncharacterized protein n=1 Tax=Pipistrellus kuhlii TaxID=59472 RepID=A0A7J7ZJC2_PIPKU|nr:hypothetical protein mPipKuh1_009417 [Pipistrellus kuhlii]